MHSCIAIIHAPMHTYPINNGAAQMNIEIKVTPEMVELAKRRRDLLNQADFELKPVLTHEEAKKIWGELVEIDGALARNLCYDILKGEPA
jgi:hypothetical protein